MVLNAIFSVTGTSSSAFRSTWFYQLHTKCVLEVFFCCFLFFFAHLRSCNLFHPNNTKKQYLTSPKHFLWSISHIQKSILVSIIPIHLSQCHWHAWYTFVIYNQIKRLVGFQWHPISEKNHIYVIKFHFIFNIWYK